jgi:hypothetical protein
LASRLLPLMNAAGAALYIGGRDPVAQHFAPIASAPNVDVIVVGNGAVGNATQAATLPNLGACPPGALQFSYGASAGFATLSFAVPDGETVALLTVSFFDESSSVPLYSFTKNITRIGKSGGPPALGLHGYKSGLLMLLMLGVMVTGGLCYFVMLASKPLEPDIPARKPARKPAAATETTPLVAATGNRWNTFSL